MKNLLLIADAKTGTGLTSLACLPLLFASRPIHVAETITMSLIHLRIQENTKFGGVAIPTCAEPEIAAIREKSTPDTISLSINISNAFTHSNVGAVTCSWLALSWIAPPCVLKRIVKKIKTVTVFRAVFIIFAHDN